PIAQTSATESSGQFSPDGKWVAYESDESGRVEVYMQGFPHPGPKLRISTNGGSQVRWRHDGQELFYIAPDGKLMAVPIKVGTGQHSPVVGQPVALFTTHISDDYLGDGYQYDITPDGNRFLVNEAVERAANSPITVLLKLETSIEYPANALLVQF